MTSDEILPIVDKETYEERFSFDELYKNEFYPCHYESLKDQYRRWCRLSKSLTDKYPHNRYLRKNIESWSLEVAEQDEDLREHIESHKGVKNNEIFLEGKERRQEVAMKWVEYVIDSVITSDQDFMYEPDSESI